MRYNVWYSSTYFGMQFCERLLRIALWEKRAVCCFTWPGNVFESFAWNIQNRTGQHTTSCMQKWFCFLRLQDVPPPWSASSVCRVVLWQIGYTLSAEISCRKCRKELMRALRLNKNIKVMGHFNHCLYFKKMIIAALNAAWISESLVGLY